MTNDVADGEVPPVSLRMQAPFAPNDGETSAPLISRFSSVMPLAGEQQACLVCGEAQPGAIEMRPSGDAADREALRCYRDRFVVGAADDFDRIVRARYSSAAASDG